MCIKCMKSGQAGDDSSPNVHQAIPIFWGKLSRLAQNIGRQLLRQDLSLRLRYILLRDQAFFKVHFFLQRVGQQISL